jgi:phosphotransferase system HPr-like phosphotransfer protein
LRISSEVRLRRRAGASSGQQVTVRATGPDAEKAVETLIGILSAVSKVGD